MKRIFVLSGSKYSQTPSTSTVWPIDHREDDRSCAWPLYSLVQIFPKALHSDITRQLGLYDGTCPNLLRGDKAPILVPSKCESGLL